MNENDAMRLLADANPVTVESLEALPRREPSRSRINRTRLVLLAAGLLALGAGSGVAVLVSRPSTHGSSGADGVTVVPDTTIPLSAASAALGGAPVVLPAQLSESDIGSVTEWGGGNCRPTDCVVTVRFPSQDIKIRYGRFIPNVDPLPGYEVSVAEDTGPGRQFIYLGDVPAYLIAKSSPASASEIDFQVGETTVSINSRDLDGAEVTALAQSIVDQTRSAETGYGTAALSDVAKIFGEPVVLPDTSVVGPSDAASTVKTACYVPDQSGQYPECQVVVDFPAQYLTIRYLRGVHDDRQAPPTSVLRDRYDAMVNHSDLGAQLLDLNGTPALYMPAQSSNAPWIEFYGGDADVLVQGPFEEATLQSIAQSIVDRSK